MGFAVMEKSVVLPMGSGNWKEINKPKAVTTEQKSVSPSGQLGSALMDWDANLATHRAIWISSCC